MPTLSTRLNSRAGAVQVAESNLETGVISVFTTGSQNNDDGWFCWRSPGTGTAKIEIWGAGGSGAKMCCCGGGLPGNPGAYSLRCISVNSSCFVCGCFGRSCGQDALCFRGTSQPTTLCWFGSGTNGCMCAQGGMGGISFCSTGTSLYCCFLASGFCATARGGANCGTVCNFGTATAISNCCCAQAYGGTINCFGGFSCASFFGCTPDCVCLFQYHVAIPSGIFATSGGLVTYGIENQNSRSNWSGMGVYEFNHALSGMSTSPGYTYPHSACWNGYVSCGCYENHGCGIWFPYGVPGLPPSPCSSVRDHATRGGHGAVRITFFS